MGTKEKQPKSVLPWQPRNNTDDVASTKYQLGEYKNWG